MSFGVLTEFKGYQMPDGHKQCGALRLQASDKPQGRKPRAGIGTAVPSLGLWEFERHGQWADAKTETRLADWIAQSNATLGASRDRTSTM